MFLQLYLSVLLFLNCGHLHNYINQNCFTFVKYVSPEGCGDDLSLKREGSVKLAKPI